MKKPLSAALFVLLIVALLSGCEQRTTSTAQTAWLHGRTDPPTAGVVVTIVPGGGAPRSTPKTNTSGFWGITPGTGLHTITVAPPAGWYVVKITHPVLGSATGNVLKATILSTTDLGADVVVWLAQVATPTPWPTLPMPPATPPIPTPPQGTADMATPTRPPTATRTATATPTATATATARPTPTRICVNEMLYLDYETRLNIRNLAMGLVGHVEDDTDPFEDLSLIWGFREFNSAPLTPRFEYTSRDGVTYQCRGFANEIIAIRLGAWPCEMGVVFWDFEWPWPGVGVEYEGGRS